MVGRVTLGKKKYAEVETQMQQLVIQAEELRGQLTKAVEEDSASFEDYMAATRLPKETIEQQTSRSAAMEAATVKAAEVPHHTAGLCLEVLKLSKIAAKSGNINAISDALSSAHLACASLKSAVANVRINIHSLNDPAPMKKTLEDTLRLLNEAMNLEEEISLTFTTRTGMQ
jgi:glutamate formiminotransferase/formiminotetrahydrofolate cyclodeaminase